MCGIFSMRGFSWAQRNKWLEKFNTIHRRGHVDNIYHNEYQGIYCKFQRLPLVAKNNENANAPYVGEDGTIVMLNGEIYNYRREYAPSEVEWIYELYRKDKRTLFYLSLLKGEFAYVIIDQTAGRVICYRSFPGVVSLYAYFDKKGRWLITSEQVDRMQKQVEPGTYYIYKYGADYSLSYSAKRGYLKKIKKDFDYILDIKEPPDVGVFNNIFHGVLRKYILHKDDDIKITVSYSGGVDSSFVLLHILSDSELRKEINQILACQYSGTEEYEIVRENLEYIKRWFGIDYYIIDMHEHNPQTIKDDIIRRLPSAKDNVIKLRSALRNYLVAKFSKNPIIIGGEGADELFGGYPFFKGTDIYEFKRKQVQSLYSMRSINLDRTNNIPFIFIKEWRVPFLDYEIVNFALQHKFSYGKGYLKEALFSLRDDTNIKIHIFTSKYGNEERLSEQYLGMKSHDLVRQ